MNYIDEAIELATNPKHTKWICPILLLTDTYLCAFIIWKIPYTEIDWIAYMQQVSQYISGERDYLLIKGQTGPLVYPAAHVYTYRVLHWATDEGRDIFAAQCIFTVVYLLSLGAVMSVYRMAKAPPYIYPLLILSKRLHSIFLLRCFNDCFAVLCLFLATYLYQKRLWTLGSLLYSWGLGVKMSLILALPATGLLLLQAIGVRRAVTQAIVIGQLQVLLAIPFLRVNARGYFSRAFEFTRQFLFKWTVNWRFIGEDVFSSKSFSLILLSTNFAVLAYFGATRWILPSQRSVRQVKRLLLNPPPPMIQAALSHSVTPRFTATTILSAMAIGMLCARSLHYQFYAYVAWTTPFLLWRAGFHPVIQYFLWLIQEWAWNVYPSTRTSSLVVVSVLAVTVAGAWWGTGGSTAEATHVEKSEKKLTPIDELRLHLEGLENAGRRYSE